MNLGIGMKLVAEKILGKSITRDEMHEWFLEKFTKDFSEDSRLLAFDWLVAFTARTDLPTDAELSDLINYMNDPIFCAEYVEKNVPKG